MDYISREEFLKQLENVQNILTSYFIQRCGDEDLIYVDRELMLQRQFNGAWNLKDGITPCYTETWLRKFIEEKTGRKVQSTVRPNNKYIIDLIGKRYHDEDINIRTDTDDLLQAYWQVAIKIAEEI